jgi:hypothetical protein
MSIIYINPYQFAAAAAYDTDAQAYITAVEAADGQSLETAVKDAINAFFVGCKSDGIFNAIKASCILAGARTLNGALVPLLSSMPTPTSFNFVDADYNRKAGLKGNGSTKYLDSNRNNGTDPQNDRHLACFVNTSQTSGAGAYIGAGAGDSGSSVIGSDVTLNTLFFRLSIAASSTVAGKAATTGFIGSSRSTASEYIVSIENTQTTFASSSESPFAVNLFVFRRNSGAAIYSDARISFYSIGESVNLALLDARVSTLMSDLAAAIP